MIKKVLYIKQHKITGLKYFGQTSRDVNSYIGSGLYWVRHCKKYGKDQVETLEVFHFDSEESCSEFALKFSKDNDIVDSSEWANLKEENGLAGNPKGFVVSEEARKKMSETRIRNGSGKGPRKPITEETRQKMREAWKNRKPDSEETRKKKSESHKGKIIPREVVDRISASNRGKKRTDEQRLKFAGKNNGMYGRKHTPETREKMRLAKLKKGL